MTSPSATPNVSAVTVDRDKRWEEIQALSRKVASKDGTPTEIESALCGAVVRARDALEELAEVKELFAAASARSETPRNEIIEECAVQCEKMGDVEEELRAREGYQFAAALRALKNNAGCPPPGASSEPDAELTASARSATRRMTVREKAIEVFIATCAGPAFNRADMREEAKHILARTGIYGNEEPSYVP